MMISPGGWTRSPVPYAIDNGRFACTTKNKPWSEENFKRLCIKAISHTIRPLFITVPDIVGDSQQTLEEWKKWTAPRGWMRRLNVPLAFVAQDGVNLDDIPTEADWVFIGGSSSWKRQNIYRICRRFKQVHVGGINTARGLWLCHNCGAKSADGTGWVRGDQTQWLGWLR